MSDLQTKFDKLSLSGENKILKMRNVYKYIQYLEEKERAIIQQYNTYKNAAIYYDDLELRSMAHQLLEIYKKNSDILEAANERLDDMAKQF